MALKNLPEVKHMIFTGTVRELNFYVADALRNNPNHNIEKIVVLDAPKENAYSESSRLSLLYVFVKEPSFSTKALEVEKA